jgi:heat shock protein HspQ
MTQKDLDHPLSVPAMPPVAAGPALAGISRSAQFRIGDVVRHRVFPFRGVIFDVDPEFANTEEWWQAIPEDIRPAKEQPFYHLFAESDEGAYVAYVSQQNLLPDDSGVPLHHPAIASLFDSGEGGSYRLKPKHRH